MASPVVRLGLLVGLGDVATLGLLGEISVRADPVELLIDLYRRCGRVASPLFRNPLVLDQFAEREPVPRDQGLSPADVQYRPGRVEVQQGPTRLLAGATAVRVLDLQCPLEPRRGQQALPAGPLG